MYVCVIVFFYFVFLVLFQTENISYALGRLTFVTPNDIILSQQCVFAVVKQNGANTEKQSERGRGRHSTMKQKQKEKQNNIKFMLVRGSL